MTEATYLPCATPLLLIPEARDHRRRRYSRASIIIALICAALTAASVLLVQRLSPATGNPTRQLTAASSSCRSFMSKLSRVSPLDGVPPADLPTAVVGGIQGSTGAILYQGHPGGWWCLLSTPSSVVAISGTTNGSLTRTPSAAQPVTIASPGFARERNTVFQLVAGQALREVTTIALTLTNGATITPTRAHGYWIAWWQGSASLESTSFSTHRGVYAGPMPQQESIFSSATSSSS